MLFLHTNYLVVYYSLYEMNTEELTASCCEKKVVNCNAHCYLDKKMSDQEDRNTKGTSSDIKLKITDYIVTDYIPDLHSDDLNILYSAYAFSHTKDHCPEIDHPPRIQLF